MKKRGPQKKDKWIPWYFVGFFVVLFILDGIFVTLALTTHRGVVTESSYDKGLRYNETVQKAEAQQALQWISSVSIEETNLRYTLKGSDNQAIKNANVTAHFSRPTQAGDDFSIALDEVEAGTYSKHIDFPAKGQWDVTLLTEINGLSHQKRKRIVIQ